MSNFDEAALFILILVPLLGAVLIMFMPKDRPKDIWYLAILVAGISLVLSLIIFARYDYEEGGFQFLIVTPNLFRGRLFCGPNTR